MPRSIWLATLCYVRDVLVVALFLYCASYMFWSSLGRLDEASGCWAFHGNRKQYRPGTELYTSEQQMFCFFYPLVRADRLRGNYHFMDDDLPEMGG